MTRERALFIEECQSRASHSVDGALLNRAAVYLIGDEQELYQAFVAEAAAQREAARPDLTVRHQDELQKAADAATAVREALEPKEQIDGERAGDSASAEETGTEAGLPPA